MLLFLFSLRSGIVESVFVSKELSSDSATNFVPHLTIAKMSRKPKTSERKRKKQKKGKKRMKQIGKVQSPQEAFLAVLRVDDQNSKK